MCLCWPPAQEHSWARGVVRGRGVHQGEGRRERGGGKGEADQAGLCQPRWMLHGAQEKGYEGEGEQGIHLDAFKQGYPSPGGHNMGGKKGVGGGWWGRHQGGGAGHTWVVSGRVTPARLPASRKRADKPGSPPEGARCLHLEAHTPAASSCSIAVYASNAGPYTMILSISARPCAKHVYVCPDERCWLCKWASFADCSKLALGGECQFWAILQ